MKKTLIKTLEIAGKPQALKRHRSFRMGEHLRQVDPSKGDKTDFLSLAHNLKPEAPLRQPLSVEFDFTFSRPKGHYGTGKNSGVLKASSPVWHISIPDADNLAKFVCDALNGVWWHDDSFICDMHIQKAYGNAAKTIMRVYTIDS